MRPYEAHPFSRSIDLTIINRPLLTNFGFLRARFFGLYAFYALLFNFNFAQLFFARFLRPASRPCQASASIKTIMSTTRDVSSFFNSQSGMKYVRLHWVDFSGVLHARTVTKARCLQLAAGTSRYASRLAVTHAVWVCPQARLGDALH
jgi:hypothetical protein